MTDSMIFPIVTVGHVDHGKSTIVGHLLAKLGALPEGKVEKIQKLCEKQKRPFEYAFILDALREEQKQGITIDTARVFFKSAIRSYQLLDAPGHVEFIKNMITGASKAEAALFIVDAVEGLQENSRRHAYLLSFLGLRQIAVLVNKMDRISYDEAHFSKLKSELETFLSTQNIQVKYTIPVSGLNGDHLTTRSSSMPWWKGPTVLEALDSFAEPMDKSHLPFRAFIQDVYKFESSGADRRMIVGQVASGKLRAGDSVMLWPTREKTTVLSLQSFGEDTPSEFSYKDNASFVLKEALFVTRGQFLTADSSEMDLVSAKTWRADLFWLGKAPLQVGGSYLLRHGPLRCAIQIHEIKRVLDTANLQTAVAAQEVHHNQAAEIIFSATENLTLDLDPAQEELSRFVIIDQYEIAGGGKLQAPVMEARSHTQLNLYPELSSGPILTGLGRPHSLIVPCADLSMAQSWGTVFASFYRNLKVPFLTLSLENPSPENLAALKATVAGGHLVGAVAVIFLLNTPEDSLQWVQKALQDYEPVPFRPMSENFEDELRNCLKPDKPGSHGTSL